MLGKGRLKGSPPAAFCYLKQGGHKEAEMASSDRHTAWGWAAVGTCRDRKFHLGLSLKFCSWKAVQPCRRAQGDRGTSILEFWVRPLAARYGFAGSTSSKRARKTLGSIGSSLSLPVILCFLDALCSLLQTNLFQQSKKSPFTFKIMLMSSVNLGKVNKLVVTVHPKAICLYLTICRTLFSIAATWEKIGESAEFDNIQWTLLVKSRGVILHNSVKPWLLWEADSWEPPMRLHFWGFLSKSHRVSPFLAAIMEKLMFVFIPKKPSGESWFRLCLCFEP